MFWKSRLRTSFAIIVSVVLALLSFLVQGLLLAAHPSLKDPNFRRSVLFLSTHKAELGAFGFVINRPLGKSAADLLPAHDSRTLLERVPVYLGGPVGHDQLSFARVQWESDEADAKLQTNLSLEEVAALIDDAPGSVRAFVGYSGWSVGQLEGELEQNAWLLLKPDDHTGSPFVHERIWYKIMNSLGPTYKLMAAVPDDLSLN